MRRRLIVTPHFSRSLKRVVRRDPPAARLVNATLAALAADARDPALRTHGLRGGLVGCWACSVTRDLRIVFRFEVEGGDEVIVLLDVGTHDEVYR